MRKENLSLVPADLSVSRNKEISNLVKIIGLQYQKKYESVDSLRYGKLMVMADQDVDGSHIVREEKLVTPGFCSCLFAEVRMDSPLVLFCF